MEEDRTRSRRGPPASGRRRERWRRRSRRGRSSRATLLGAGRCIASRSSLHSIATLRTRGSASQPSPERRGCRRAAYSRRGDDGFVGPRLVPGSAPETRAAATARVDAGS